MYQRYKGVPMKKEYDVPALRKGLKVFELLCGSEAALGLTEISSGVGLNKHMTLRVLHTLRELGWIVEESGGPKYRPGLRPFCIASKPIERMAIRSCAHEPLHKLWEATGESVQLWVLDDDVPMILESFETKSRMIRMAPPVGFRNPELHSGAPGKVFLTFGPGSLRTNHFMKPLKKLTAKTMTTPACIKRELAAVKKAGYALDREEGWDGVLCVAAPVFSHDRSLAGVICMTVARTYYTAREMESAFAKKVLQTARVISRNFGFVEPKEEK
jgi:IclR family acetate operon transcriptional repressor